MNDSSMQPASPESTPEPIESSVDIAQPTQPEPHPDSPQTFKCEKCGATFTDEGSAAAHIQTCKGPEEEAAENDDQQQKVTPNPSPRIA